VENKMLVKICGITNLEDAERAIEYGADALGFIFVPASPRYVPTEIAASIISRLPSTVQKVGVFVNESERKIHSMIEQTGITHLQFHGDEMPDDLAGYTLPVWKAFRVSPAFDVAVISKYSADAYLLDTFSSKSYGGTGKTFDWRIAARVKQYGNIILSGGLNPHNVADAVRTVQPYGIDVNSGVEATPGKKDAAKLKKLFDELKRL
jgi:phosphoribosylanthranilate isomerase